MATFSLHIEVSRLRISMIIALNFAQINSQADGVSPRLVPGYYLLTQSHEYNGVSHTFFLLFFLFRAYGPD
jgi:hypothetical protein